MKCRVRELTDHDTLSDVRNRDRVRRSVASVVCAESDQSQSLCEMRHGSVEIEQRRWRTATAREKV